jgi:hypothetical protein
MILRFLSFLLFLLQSIQLVRSTALTTVIAANERLCFYADVDKSGEKIGVSFRSRYSCQRSAHSLNSVLFCRTSANDPQVFDTP